MNTSDTAKKVALNTGFQMIGKIVSMGITIAVTVLVARYLGKSAYGEFSLMQTWPALFFIVVDFGFNAIAVREIGKAWNKAGTYLGTIILLRIIMSLVIIVVFSAALTFFPYSEYLKKGILLSMLLVVTQGLFASGNIIFQAKLRYDLSAFATIAGYFVILLSTLYSVFFNKGVVAVSMSYVVGGFFTFFLAQYYIHRAFPEVRYCFSFSLSKDLFKQSLPLGLMFLFSQLNFKSDAILLSVLKIPSTLQLSNNEAVAVYSLPYKVFEVALVLPTFFMNAVYPVFISSLKLGNDRLRLVFSKSVKMLMYGGTLVAVVGFMAAPFIIKFLGGAEFKDSTLVLRILMSGIFLYFVTQPLAWLLVTLGKQKILPFIYLISATINITLNYTLIPKYGFLASAIITHISEALILVMLIIAVKRNWTQTNVTVSS